MMSDALAMLQGFHLERGLYPCHQNTHNQLGLLLFGTEDFPNYILAFVGRDKKSNPVLRKLT